MTFPFQLKFTYTQHSRRPENQYDMFVNVVQYITPCFHLFKVDIFYDNSCKEPQSTMGDSHIFLFDEYAVYSIFLYTYMRYR